MSLNHTIRLINDDYKSALADLILNHYEADVILTKLNKIYFDKKEITESNMKELGCLFSSILNNQGSIYTFVQSDMLGEVLVGFKAAGLRIRNVLTIPILLSNECQCSVCNRKSYDENKILYAVYATKSCLLNRVLNYTDIIDSKGSCKYPACWSWFKGTEIQAYETILKISSDHRDEVFDPFMFAGDVGVAAINADRHFTGCESDGARYREVKDRLDHVGE